MSRGDCRKQIRSYVSEETTGDDSSLYKKLSWSDATIFPYYWCGIQETEPVLTEKFKLLDGDTQFSYKPIIILLYD